jgi:hypothetical protein
MYSCVFLAFRSSWRPGRRLTVFRLEFRDGGDGSTALEAQVVLYAGWITHSWIPWSSIRAGSLDVISLALSWSFRAGEEGITVRCRSTSWVAWKLDSTQTFERVIRETLLIVSQWLML